MREDAEALRRRAGARRDDVPECPFLVILSGALKHRKVLLMASRTVVGRGGGCHVRLPDPYVSHEHLALERRADGVWAEDLGSANGSRVNSASLTGPRRLADGDRLRLGRTEAEFRCPAAPSGPPPG